MDRHAFATPRPPPPPPQRPPQPPLGASFVQGDFFARGGRLVFVAMVGGLR